MPSAGWPQEVTVRPQHAVILEDSKSLLQKVESGIGSPDWNMSVNGLHPPSRIPVGVLPWACRCEGKCTEQIDWRAKQHSQVACGSKDLSEEELETLTCGQKVKDITPLIAWRREAWKEESARRSSFKGRERGIVSQTNIGTDLKATLGKLHFC